MPRANYFKEEHATGDAYIQVREVVQQALREIRGIRKAVDMDLASRNSQ